MAASPVTLRVYDLSHGMARQLSPALLGRTFEGIWHTGVLVFGTEYFYGGGIQALAPHQVQATYGMQPMEEVSLGATSKSQAELETFLRSISPRYTAATYDLLRHNCNNFSDEVARFLVGHGIPQHILDLPNEALSTPLGATLRPMIENMQQSMGAHAAESAFNIPFNNPPAVTTMTAPLVSLASVSRKFVVSKGVTMHLNGIIKHLEEVTAEDGVEIASIHQLVDRIDKLQTENEGDRAFSLSCWQELEKLPTKRSALFAWLCVLRVLLLVPTKSSDIQEIVSRCLDRVLKASSVDAPALPNASSVLVLSGWVNAFASEATRDLALARAADILPTVFRALTEASSSADVRQMGAAVVHNCCLAVKDDAVLLTTLICGCVEVLDRTSREEPKPADLQRMIGGVAVLVQDSEAARSLAMELGLADVLLRLQTSASLTHMRPLLTQLVALI